MGFDWFKPHRLPGEPRHATNTVNFEHPDYEGRHGKEGDGSYSVNTRPRPGVQVPTGWGSR